MFKAQIGEHVERAAESEEATARWIIGQAMVYPRLDLVSSFAQKWLDGA